MGLLCLSLSASYLLFLCLVTCLPHCDAVRSLSPDTAFRSQHTQLTSPGRNKLGQKADWARWPVPVIPALRKRAGPWRVSDTYLVWSQPGLYEIRSPEHKTRIITREISGTQNTRKGKAFSANHLPASPWTFARGL